MPSEIFDYESESKRRHPSSSSIHRHKSRNKFNWIILLALILCAGFFVVILCNFMIGEKIIVQSDVEADILSSNDHAALSEDEETCENLCMTRECVIEAARILTFMDDSKDPCDDFYEYACGNYPKTKAVRFGEEVYDTHTEVADNIDINIKKFMDKGYLYEEDEGYTKMKFLYDSCMNGTERKINSSDKLTQFFEHHGLTWPILNDESTGNEVSWTHFVGEMEKYGIPTLFHTHVVNVDAHFISVVLSCSMPMLSPHVYLNPNDEESSSEIFLYRNVILLLLDYMGIRVSEAKKVFEEIMDLDKALAQTYTEENSIEECNRPCTKAECASCKKEASEVTHPISRYHEQQLEEMFAEVLNTQKGNIHLRTACSGNLREMMNILNSASNKTVANYIGWRAAVHLLKYMDPEFKELYNHYAGRLVDADTIPGTRWRECSQVVRNNMGVVVSQALIKDNYFNQEQIKEVQKRFTDVKDSFVYSLHTVPWLQNETMSFFIRKLNKISLRIGYMDKINQSDIMNGLYKDLDINSADSYFNNILKLKVFLTRGKNSMENSTVSFLKFLRPMDSFGRYDYETNTVEIGLGNLIYPLLHFGPGLLKYLENGQNMVLAHQISHAFDSTGVMYDADGSRIDLRNVPPITLEKYEEMIFCLKRKYPMPQMWKDHVNPSFYIDQEIADLGSFYITEAGVNRDAELDHDADESSRMPALPMTKKQIFFLQISQMFCEARETHTVGHHYEKFRRTKKERVNLAVSNMINFGEVFNCAPGTKMNPVQKCNLITSAFK